MHMRMYVSILNTVSLAQRYGSRFCLTRMQNHVYLLIGTLIVVVILVIGVLFVGSR